jgi:hypothetical protein
VSSPNNIIEWRHRHSFQTTKLNEQTFAIPRSTGNRMQYDGLETTQNCLLYVFVWVYVNLCMVRVIELIVFLYNKEAVYMVPLTRNSIKCEVFWAIEISRTSWSNKVACYKLYQIPCFRQKTMLLNAINRLLPLHNFYSAFLVSLKQYLLKKRIQLLKILHTSLNLG